MGTVGDRDNDEQLKEKDSEIDKLKQSNSALRSEIKKTTRNSAIFMVIVIITLFATSLNTYVTYMDKVEDIMGKYGEIEFVSDNIVQGFYKDTSVEEVQKIVVESIVNSLGDVYTTYYDKEEFSVIQGSLKGNNVGLGLHINNIDGEYIVDYVYSESPGYKSGIIPGDKIISIGEIDLAGGVVNPIDIIPRGKGSIVKLKLLRNDEVIEVELVVGKYKVDTVESEKIGDVGYINISQFTEKTDKEFEKALKELSSKDLRGYIIDVRGNPGGAVTTTAKSMGMLNIDGDIATLRGVSDKVVYKSKSKGIIEDLPIVIIADENSASASEIFIQGLRHYKGSKIVGKKTYGKALAQNVMKNRQTGTGLVLTVFEVILPGNVDPAINGIKPDIEVDLEGEIYSKSGDINTDTQLKKALELIGEH